MGDAIKEFLNCRGVVKIMRFLVNEKFCHRECDFLEEDFCTRFETRLEGIGDENYIARCQACQDYSKDCEK